MVTVEGPAPPWRCLVHPPHLPSLFIPTLSPTLSPHQDTLPRRQRAAALRKYGKVLISQRAESATRLLMELCIGGGCGHPGGGGGGGADAGNEAEEGFVSGVADFAHLYCDRPTALMLLCEFILNSGGSTASSSAVHAVQAVQQQNDKMLYHTLLELYLAEHLPDEAGAPPPQTQQPAPPSSSPSPLSTPSLPAPSPPPSAASSSLPPPPPPSSSAAADMQQLAARRGRALELLQRGWPAHLVNEPKYDADHALVRKGVGRGGVGARTWGAHRQ